MSPGLTDLLLRAQSDERLVRLVAAGHMRAFDAIVERYRSELIAFATRRMGAAAAAEDVVQQVLLSALSALQRGTDVRHLRGWLFQITRHAVQLACIPGDQPLDDLEMSTDALEDVVERRAEARSALAGIASLPERQRVALVGMTVGNTRSEMAAAMGLSEGAVRQLVHRARAAVRASVTAVTPWWMVRGLINRGAGGSGGDAVMIGGGALSSGIGLKVGAVVASGALAGAVAILPGRHVRPLAERVAPHSAHAALVHPARGAVAKLASGGGAGQAAAAGGTPALVSTGNPGARQAVVARGRTVPGRASSTSSTGGPPPSSAGGGDSHQGSAGGSSSATAIGDGHGDSGQSGGDATAANATPHGTPGSDGGSSTRDGSSSGSDGGGSGASTSGGGGGGGGDGGPSSTSTSTLSSSSSSSSSGSHHHGGSGRPTGSGD